MIHVIHGIFLLASLYVAFDPPFSPSRIGGGLAFLPCYYLGALGVGYFSGYFLLIFGSKSGSSKSWERPSALRRTLDYAVLALVWIAFLAVPAGMIYRNYPQLRINHGRDLAKFGVLAAKSLPASGAVVLSDDPYRLYAVRPF